MKFPCFCAKGMPKEDDDVPPPRPAPKLTPVTGSKELNPPNWPATVQVVEPDGKFVGDKQAFFDQLYSDGGKYSIHPWAAESPNSAGYGGYFDETGRDFCTQRTAILLKPGAHRAKFNVGFYNCLVGLGDTPDAVKLDAFECLNGVGADHVQHGLSPGALNNFWRSVEGVQTSRERNIYYFVSQASPLRRCHIQGQLRLAGSVGGGIWDWGYASGGFAADCLIDGGVELGGQQQWLSRNVSLGGESRFEHGAWSSVLVGCTPPGRYTQDAGARVTEVAQTEVIAEKPFIVYQEADNRYILRVPRTKSGTVGHSWGASSSSECDSIDFEQVYVAEAGVSTATIINKKLSEGKHIVLSPGIYKLDKPIVITNSGTVFMGLGMATLQPSESAPWMDSLLLVNDGIQGVRVAGLMLQAGERGCDALLKWGKTKNSAAANIGAAGFMFDIFCRVGGDRSSVQTQVWTEKMVEVNSCNVVGDNLWLWRADHEVPNNVGVRDSRNRANHSLVVNGDNVIMYGLFCEHALQDLTVWNGESGRTYFYQCELPYDVNQSNFGDQGFVGYRIADGVQNHKLQGAGVYSYFRDNDVHAKSAFKAPEGRSGIRLDNIFTVFLNGKGCIEHILNRQGRSCSSASQGRPCFL